MIDNDIYGHFINDYGEIEYFPVIKGKDGKAYNLIALKALLLAVRNFKIEVKCYEYIYGKDKYISKKYTITSYGCGSKKRKK